jgi:spore coat polysaccharide biosynthesis protein SpsF
MSLYIIIQARMTSTRLPKKVALPLAGMRVLEVLLTRLSEYRDNIIVATTDCGAEEPILEMADKCGVKSFRGSEDDVLSRYYHSALHYGAKSGDTIVRITSDCPLHSADIIKNCLHRYESIDVDYLCSDIHHSYPRGFDTEIFSFDLLQESYQNAKEEYEREHVTPYLKSKDGIRIEFCRGGGDNSEYRLTLDTTQDYEVIDTIYKHFDNRVDISYDEIIEYLNQNPKIAQKNRDVKQKSYTSKS